MLILASIRHEISKAFEKRWYPDAKNNNNNVGFEVFTAVAEKSFSSWDISPYIPMKTDVSEEHVPSVLKVERK
jgi:hypothetical protein